MRNTQDLGKWAAAGHGRFKENGTIHPSGTNTVLPPWKGCRHLKWTPCPPSQIACSVLVDDPISEHKYLLLYRSTFRLKQSSLGKSVGVGNPPWVWVWVSCGCGCGLALAIPMTQPTPTMGIFKYL
jgi:hypothetical protein